MLGALGAIAIESRAAPRGGSRESQARHATGIAGEALAACGRWGRAVDGAAAGTAVWVVEPDAPRVLAVLAAVPGLPLAESMPWPVRTVLRVLGIPMLDEPVAGVRVVVGDPSYVPFSPTMARVIEESTGYRVAFAPRA